MKLQNLKYSLFLNLITLLTFYESHRNVFYLFVANFQYKTQGKNKIAEQLHETIGQSVELPYFGEQDLKTVLKLEPREYLQRKKELLIDRIHNSIKIQT